MPTPTPFPAHGGCDCRSVRYRLETPPLFVHCCHCRWCQRESGASFALNAMIEADRVTNLGVEPEVVHTPSESGAGQKVARCPKCRVAVWSHYAGTGPVTRFVRVGTLDDPDLLPPDIHIFTRSMQPWIVLPDGVPAVPEYYEREQHWPPESLARREKLLPAIAAYQASLKAGAASTAAAHPAPRPLDIPTLATDRLLLEPPSEAAWGAYERFYTDAEASAMYGGPLTVRQAWARLASDIGTWHLQGFGVWLVRRRREGDYVGTCGFWQGMGWPRELTWWLLPEARGQGLAKEASLAAIAHGYEGFGWSAVQTYMKDDNAAARALVLGLGGTQVERRVFPDGLERSIYLLPRPPTAR